MNTGEWQCTCGVNNDGGVRYCESCGAEHARAQPTPASPPSVPTGPSAYREVTRPTEVLGKHHDDPARCTIPACQAPSCAAYVRSCVRAVARLASLIAARQ